MLKVLVPATSKQLTTLEMAYDFLGISSDAGADAQLNFLIDVASDIIAGYCGREFALQKYEEKLPGYGTNKLLLSVTPIKNIESVTVDGLPVDDYEVESDEAGILYRSKGWVWRPKLSWDIVYSVIPNSEELNVDVVYEAGFILPGQEGRDLPGDLEYACLLVIKALLETEERSPGITSERIGDWQASYSADIVPGSVISLLEPWKCAV